MLFHNKQLFVAISKCKTGDIDRRYDVRSYDRSTTSQSGASFWPAARLHRPCRHNGAKLTPAARVYGEPGLPAAIAPFAANRSLLCQWNGR
jgi:hypothetical protein